MDEAIPRESVILTPPEAGEESPRDCFTSLAMTAQHIPHRLEWIRRKFKKQSE
jgi:hypothetical protein